MDDPWFICPVCDGKLEAKSACTYFGLSVCPKGHYRLQGNGNYAVIATLNGKDYDLEEGYGDEKAYYAKLKEMREEYEFGMPDWHTAGF